MNRKPFFVWVSPGVYAGPFPTIADVVAYLRWTRDAARRLRVAP